jgi:hypothetical protein
MIGQTGIGQCVVSHAASYLKDKRRLEVVMESEKLDCVQINVKGKELNEDNQK